MQPPTGERQRQAGRGDREPQQPHGRGDRYPLSQGQAGGTGRQRKQPLAQRTGNPETEQRRSDDPRRQPQEREQVEQGARHSAADAGEREQHQRRRHRAGQHRQPGAVGGGHLQVDLQPRQHRQGNRPLAKVNPVI